MRITKKALLFSCCIAAASSAFAGSIDAKSNLSLGYLRNPSRNTESKRPEAVLYNLAGTAFMDDGLYFDGANQFVAKKYWHTLEGSSDATTDATFQGLGVKGNEYKDEEPVLLYPDFNVVYKMKNGLAFGFGFAVAAGGGSLDYKDGTALTTGLLLKSAQAYAAKSAQAAQALQKTALDHELEVTSITYGETLSVAYRINPQVSVAAGIRFLEATQKMTLSSSQWTAINGGEDVSYDASGFGVGGIFGVHYKPIERIDLTLQYKTITKMEMKLDSVDGNVASGSDFGLTEDKKFDNDLPAELNMGFGIHATDKLYISASGNYYFNEQADVGNALSSDNIDWGNSWEVGIGADWNVTDKLLLSTGTWYSNQGSDDETNNVFSPALDSYSMAFGGEYQFTKTLTGSFGLLITEYTEKDYSTGGLNLELDKRVVQGAVGVTYHPF